MCTEQQARKRSMGKNETAFLGNRPQIQGMGRNLCNLPVAITQHDNTAALRFPIRSTRMPHNAPRKRWKLK